MKQIKSNRIYYFIFYTLYFLNCYFNFNTQISLKNQMQIQRQDCERIDQLSKQSQNENSYLKLSQIAIQTKSQNSDSSPPNCRSDSSQNSKKSERQNIAQTGILEGYLSLRNIRSKEQIQIQSKQNQGILLNLNFNIDDLFKKISCLTQQITTDLRPKQFNDKSASILQQQLSPTEKSRGKQANKTKSSPLIDHKESYRNNEDVSQYQPIFFQLSQKRQRQFAINMKLFQTGKSLGYGKFGQVVECKNVKTNYLYALKKIFKSVIEQYGMQEQLLTELKILTQIDHPNIVKAFQAFTDDFHVFILMENIHGNLLTKKFKCGEAQVKIIIKQVLQALKYLHEKKIVHRDIKPQNIILTFDNVVKICDFGWGSQNNDKMNILCGTLDYVSPQMVNQQEYSDKIDLWNVGVLTYELIHGYAPFKASSKSRIFEKVKNLSYTFSDQIQISQQCKSFISGLLKYQRERQSIQWGLQHDFLKQLIPADGVTEGNNMMQEIDKQFADFLDKCDI